MKDRHQKILVLYTSVGMGHKFIAENISYHLEQAGFEVRQHDILQVQEGVLVNFGIWLHSFINRRLPFIWRWLYFSKLVNLISLPLRVTLAKGNSKNLENIVKEFDPDLILSTQTTASAAVSSLIENKKYFGKFVIAFSDYHLHKFWLYDQADLYLANTPEQKTEMISLGVDDQKIVVCGITLKPLEPIQGNILKSELGISLEDKIVVFGSGSLGIGFDFELLKNYLVELTQTEKDLSIVVLCGKNTELYRKLTGLEIPKVYPQKFFYNPGRLYQIADVLVTKPGGLTIAEALQANIKILITHTLPGQEEPNYDYLLERNLIHPFPKPLTSHNLVTQTLAILNEPPSESGIIADNIIQRGQEGKVVVSTITQLFHSAIK